MVRRMLLVCGLVLVTVLSTARADAAETGHYVNGVEGVKAGTVPPPGWYSRNYFVYYHADDWMDKDGDDANLDLDLEVNAWVTRLIWITPKKFLGADYGMQLVGVLQRTDLKNRTANVEDEDVGLGDATFAPVILSWHKPKFDLAVGYELFMPTGEYDQDEPASPGKDMWTHMFDFGGTYYFDKAKTWHASVLGRYEIHSEKDEREVRPGDDLHFEWGIGKTFMKTLDVGVSGYCQWQVTDDKGSDVNWDKDVHDRVFAIGGEISYFHPPTKIQVGLRHVWEFGARDRTEGHVTCLTLMKVF